MKGREVAALALVALASGCGTTSVTPTDAGTDAAPLGCNEPQLWARPVDEDHSVIHQGRGRCAAEVQPIAVHWLRPSLLPIPVDEWAAPVCWRVVDAPAGSGWTVGETIASEEHGWTRMRLLADEPVSLEGRLQLADGRLHSLGPIEVGHDALSPTLETVVGDVLAIGWQGEAWVSRTHVRASWSEDPRPADVLDAVAADNGLVWVEARGDARVLMVRGLDETLEVMETEAPVRLFPGVFGALVGDELVLLTWYDLRGASPRRVTISPPPDQILSHDRGLLVRRGTRVTAHDEMGVETGALDVPGLLALVPGGVGVLGAWASLPGSLQPFAHSAGEPPRLAPERAIVPHEELREPQVVTEQVVYGAGGWQSWAQPEVRGPTFFPVDRLALGIPVAQTEGTSYAIDDGSAVHLFISFWSATCE